MLTALEQYLSSVLTVDDDQLYEAMHYACLNGGKRIRARLMFAAAQAIQTPIQSEALITAAAAMEMLHAYSLVHDDLPCMDDDDLRRGKPTVHKQYNEAIAVLAGDGLQSKAFTLLSQLPLPALQVVQIIQIFSQGALAMVQGQMVDTQSVNKVIDLAQLQQMHRLKTGALIRASILIGALIQSCQPTQYQALDRFAQSIGMAFQVIDDILDVTANTTALGKTAGKDQAHNKPTFVSLLGLEQARRYAQDLYQQGIEALNLFPHCDELKQMARLIVERTF